MCLECLMTTVIKYLCVFDRKKTFKHETFACTWINLTGEHTFCQKFAPRKLLPTSNSYRTVQYCTVPALLFTTENLKGVADFERHYLTRWWGGNSKCLRTCTGGTHFNKSFNFWTALKLQYLDGVDSKAIVLNRTVDSPNQSNVLLRNFAMKRILY